MKTIIRQTTFLVMVLLAVVCHGANTNRYDYSKLKYLTASDINKLEIYREILRKAERVDPDKIEPMVWAAARKYNINSWCVKAVETSGCIKDLKVVELPKPKPKRKSK